jgi:hypothetical protein
MSLQATQSTSSTRSDLSAAIAAAFPCVEPRPVLLTVEQFSARNPAFTPPALRNLIFKAEPRQSTRGAIPGNGLAESGAIIRLGRRVLIDENLFLKWVAQTGTR